jgi:hypothetical protein
MAGVCPAAVIGSLPALYPIQPPRLLRLRRRCLYLGHLAAVIGVVVGMLVGFAVNRPLLSLLTEPYCRLPSEIRGATTAVAGDARR